MSQLIPLVLLFVVFWFVLIRPQQRRQREHRQLMSGVGVGDEVVTVGGMFGVVTGLDDESVTLEVADGVRVRFARQAIGRKIVHEEDGPAAASGDGSGDGA